MGWGGGRTSGGCGGEKGILEMNGRRLAWAGTEMIPEAQVGLK